MNYEHVEDIYPLTPMQQGMLFHSLYAPGDGMYLTQSTCALHGILNRQAFERAWQAIMDRHPVLRTSFIWEELAEPVQVVCKNVAVPLTYLDWLDMAPDAQEAQLAEYLQEGSQHEFTLAEVPLMRITLIKRAADVHQFVWSHHHVLLDGWSIPLLVQEVFALYDAFCHGQQPALKPSRPFRDYIAWLQQQEPAPAAHYWRESLQGFSTPPVLNIATTQASDPGTAQHRGFTNSG